MEGHGLPCCTHMGTFNIKHIIKIREINIFKQLCAIWREVLFLFQALNWAWFFQNANSESTIGTEKQKRGCSEQALLFKRWIKVKNSVENTGYEGIKYNECGSVTGVVLSSMQLVKPKAMVCSPCFCEGSKSQLLVIRKQIFGQCFQTGLLGGTALTTPHNMFVHWNLCLAFLASYPQGKSRIRHRSRGIPAETAATAACEFFLVLHRDV